LIFLNKGAHFSSITGEKLSEFQVVTAVKQSQQRTGIDIGEFCVAPQMHDRPAYVLLTETVLNNDSQESMAECVDDMLGKLNCEYADKRRSGRILPLTIRQVPQGTWLTLRKNKSAARGNFEEYKHRCLVAELGFAERLTSPSFSISTNGNA
jgi:hypothetical protein